MALRVAAWNIRDSLSSEASLEEVIFAVNEMDADVVVLSEAYAEGSEELLDDARSSFAGLGYKTKTALYEDTDGRLDRHGIMTLSRLAGEQSVRRIANRNSMFIEAVDPEFNVPVKILGAHMDDRKETTRLRQAEAVIDHVEFHNADDSLTVVAGDLNAMHGADGVSRALRMARPVAELLPVVDPGQDHQTLLSRIGSLSTRLSDMASGSVMAMFEEAGFQDADPNHQPTCRGFAQLDHILFDSLSGDYAAHTFTRHPRTHLTDHNAISAVLEA